MHSARSQGSEHSYSTSEIFEESNQSLLQKEEKNEFQPQQTRDRNDSMWSHQSDEEMANRLIKINRENTRIKFCCKCKLRFFSKRKQLYKNNKISTSKYNFLTFLPLNLLLQFSKMANLYFLILMIMELYPPISDSPNSKVPALLLPLSFVVGLSMIKDIWEDIKRHRSDNEENNRRVEVGSTYTKDKVLVR